MDLSCRGPARALFLLAVSFVVCCLALGMGALPGSQPAGSTPPAPESAPEPSVTCTPLGLYGDITMQPVTGSLNDTGGDLTFVGTTNGLYAVASDGKLSHFLYSPFGIRHIALIEDVTGDGTREVVVALNDTQVPALRCYDGATWEKLWQFAPMARIWDRLWVDRQSIITNLGVTGEGDSQSVLITSGRCALSLNAANGAEQWRSTTPSALWRMVTLADLNEDGSGEVLVGCDGGQLIWLDAGTGKWEWQTKLPEHDADSVSVSHLISDIIVLDEEGGLLATASGDGSAQVFDLRARKLMWDTLAFEEVSGNPDLSVSVLLSVTADITGDSLGELLLTQAFDLRDASGSVSANGRALCDSAGNVVWKTDRPQEGSLVWPGVGLETDLFEGQPVYLNVADSDNSRTAMTMVDARDGRSVLRTVPLDAVGSGSVVMKRPQGDGYLAFSSSADLAAISAGGGLLWYYPRITGIEAERGNFVGNGTEDLVLEWGSTAGPYSESSVRLFQVMDGATGAVAWSYEVPHAEWVSGGGLKALQVTADLAGGDGVPDIAGCLRERVFIFSGRDGTVSSFDAGQPVSSLGIIRNGAAGVALVLNASEPSSENAGGLLIVDQAGETIWSTVAATWLGDEIGSFVTLDDINSDNVGDLAVYSGSRILVLGSTGDASGYEVRQTIPAESGVTIRLPEMVGDSDGDGARELAFLQEGPPQTRESKGGYYADTPHHSLCVLSPEDGQVLFKADLQGTIEGYDLGCGDFNADGRPDSVVLVQESFQDEEGYGERAFLRILSGRDGTLVWETGRVGFDYGFGYSSEGGVAFTDLRVMNVGDINGDGADDLAWALKEWDVREYGHALEQGRLEVFDALHNTTLKDIAVTMPLEIGSGTVVDGRTSETMLLTDVDADGHGEVIMAAGEPWLPTYDPDSSANQDDGQSSPRCLVLVDLDSGRRTCAFTGFDPAGVAVLPGQRPGVLALAACGGFCFLHLDADLQLTSPENGASSGPAVGVSWESRSGGGCQVFVDGVRNDITSGFESDLYLGQGEHQIVVRSIDDWGRVSYGPADLDTPVTISVAPSPWKPVWLVIGLLALAVVTLALFYPRLHRRWRARRLPHGGSNVR